MTDLADPVAPLGDAKDVAVAEPVAPSPAAHTRTDRITVEMRRLLTAMVARA